jgi:hypothetical protein
MLRFEMDLAINSLDRYLDPYFWQVNPDRFKNDSFKPAPNIVTLTEKYESLFAHNF